MKTLRLQGLIRSNSPSSLGRGQHPVTPGSNAHPRKKRLAPTGQSKHQNRGSMCQPLGPAALGGKENSLETGFIWRKSKLQSLRRPLAFMEWPKKVMSQLPRTGVPPGPLRCLMESPPPPGKWLFSRVSPIRGVCGPGGLSDCSGCTCWTAGASGKGGGGSSKETPPGQRPGSSMHPSPGGPW